MNVSAVIVTRGNVDLRPILDSLPPAWEQVVWNNAGGVDGASATVSVQNGRKPMVMADVGPDLGVYGRYAAIAHASHDLIYVQDDDCIVSDPEELVSVWGDAPDHVIVCNQPEPWRSNPFYADHALVGFGAAFHRDVPQRAFATLTGPVMKASGTLWIEDGWFRRTCDIVVTALTPRVLVSVPHESFAYAWGDDRMWRQPTHQAERDRMLALVKEIA